MNLNRRVEKLENKLMPGIGVLVIELDKGETQEQAKQRYCENNGMTRGDLDNLGPDSMVILLNIHFD